MLIYFKSGYARLLHRFPGRALEWWSALILSTIGWTLLIEQSPEIFSSPYFFVMNSMASQETWGSVLLCIGGLRVVFLFINGTMPRTSSYLRAAGSFLSCFAWFSICFGLATNQVAGLGLSVFPWLLVGELYSLHRASTDARLADNLFRETRSTRDIAHGKHA